MGHQIPAHNIPKKKHANTYQVIEGRKREYHFILDLILIPLQI